MTREEYDSIKSGKDYDLKKLVDREINKILRTDSIGNGINRCYSSKQVDEFIKSKIIFWVDINKLRNELQDSSKSISQD